MVPPPRDRHNLLADLGSFELVLGERGGQLCAWLRRSNGREYAVTWPHGYQVRREPLALVDGERVVAGPNAVLLITGGEGGPLPKTCRVAGTSIVAFGVEMAKDASDSDS